MKFSYQSEEVFDDCNQLVEACRSVGIPSALAAMAGTYLSNLSERHIADPDGGMNHIGRNIVSAAIARLYADGVSSEGTQDRDSWKNQLRRLVNMSYNQVPYPNVSSVDGIIMLDSDLPARMSCEYLWRTTLLNSGINLSSKNAISRWWLFLTEYWELAAEEHQEISGLLTQLRGNFLRELYLVLWMIHNGGWVRNGMSISSQDGDFFSPERDLPFHAPTALSLPDIDSIYNQPDDALQAAREMPIVSFPDGAIGVVQPESLITSCADRVVRRTISQAHEASNVAIRKLRSFVGQLFELHVKAIAEQCVPERHMDSLIVPNLLFVDEFIMGSEPGNQIASPDCFLIGMQRIALEAKYRELWEIGADMYEWYRHSLSANLGTYQPRQFENLINLWRQGATSIIERLGSIDDGREFYYFTVVYSAPSWMNSRQFKEHISRLDRNTDMAFLNNAFFIGIDELEALAVFHDRSSGEGVSVDHVLANYAKYCQAESMIDFNNETVTLNMIEFMLERRYLPTSSNTGPEFMQSAFDSCWDELLGVAFE